MLLQRELWIQNRKMWPRFFKAIDWVQGENNVYRWVGLGWVKLPRWGRCESGTVPT